MCDRLIVNFIYCFRCTYFNFFSECKSLMAETVGLGSRLAHVFECFLLFVLFSLVAF